MMTDFRGRPAYLQIADDLRSRVLDGSLQDGEKLPSESELMGDYGVSRIVVRNAVEVLRHEGLVATQHGKGSFVRNQRPKRQRVMGHLYGERPSTSPFAAAARASGMSPEWEYQSRRTTATKTVAQRLGIEPGDPIMKTSYRFLADDEPVMLSTSHEPLALTQDTPIEQPEGSPVTGVVPRFDQIGIHVTSVIEDVNARAPRPYEAEALHIGAGIPVLVIERTYYAGELPIETADIVVPADRYLLTYQIPIPSRD